MRGRTATACFALTVPVALLALAPAPPVKSSPAASVRHVTEVKRIVKVERKQVRVAKVVPVPAAAPITSERPRVAAPVVRKPAVSLHDESGSKQTPAKGDPTKTPEAASEQPVKPAP